MSALNGDGAAAGSSARLDVLLGEVLVAFGWTYLVAMMVLAMFAGGGVDADPFRAMALGGVAALMALTIGLRNEERLGAPARPARFLCWAVGAVVAVALLWFAAGPSAWREAPIGLLMLMLAGQMVRRPDLLRPAKGGRAHG